MVWINICLFSHNYFLLDFKNSFTHFYTFFVFRPLKKHELMCETYDKKLDKNLIIFSVTSPFLFHPLTLSLSFSLFVFNLHYFFPSFLSFFLSLPFVSPFFSFSLTFFSLSLFFFVLYQFVSFFSFSLSLSCSWISTFCFLSIHPINWYFI